MSDLQNTVEHVIARAKKSGATAADAMIREDDTFSVTVRMAEVETLKEAISRSLMMRVFIGKRTATSHTSDLSKTVTSCGSLDSTSTSRTSAKLKSSTGSQTSQADLASSFDRVAATTCIGY